MSKVVPFSSFKANIYTDLKKKSDQDIVDLYNIACHFYTYYVNADSFSQLSSDKESMDNHYNTKTAIEEYVRKYRPQLKQQIGVK